MNDHERYEIEFNSDRNCSVYQRTRVRWNDDGTVSVFEWQRNPMTMEGYGWRRYDVATVTVDGTPVVLASFAPAGRTVRCAAAVVRPWGRDELEIQGAAERNLTALVPA